MLKDRGYTVKAFTFSDSNDVNAIAEKACDESDVIYIPTDNTAASCIETIKNVLTNKQTPMIAGEAGICKAGIATLSISYYDLGYQTGLMAYEVLVNGKNIAEMEIKYLDTYKKLFNEEMGALFEITMPEGYEKLS